MTNPKRFIQHAFFSVILLLYINPSVVCAKNGGAKMIIKCIEKERQALLKFQQGLVDDSGRLISWGSKDCCTWSGVHCNNITAYEGYYFDGGDFVGNALVQWKRRELEYKKNLGLLKSIDLSSNKLAGSIPQEFASLRELISLNLSRNCLTGNIIQKIDQLKMLESLDLSQNQLSGAIPVGFVRLSYLSVLDLSNNNLSGKIPSSTQLQSFNASNFAGNLELCGLPLPNKCSGDETPTTEQGKDNNLQEDEDRLITPGFYLSAGLGFAVGFWAVFGTFLLKLSSANFKFLDKIKVGRTTKTENAARMQRMFSF